MAVVQQVQQAVVNHPTTAASGLGGSLSIAIMSLLLHLNVHLTEEEALAWSSILIALLGWVMKWVGAHYPMDAPGNLPVTIVDRPPDPVQPHPQPVA